MTDETEVVREVLQTIIDDIEDPENWEVEFSGSSEQRELFELGIRTAVEGISAELRDVLEEL